MTKVKRNVLLSPRRFTAIDNDTRLAFLRLSANRDFHEEFRKSPQDNRAMDLRRETHRRRSSRGISARKSTVGSVRGERKRQKKKEHFVGRVVGRTPSVHVDMRKPEEKRGASRDEKRAQALALEFPTGARVRARAQFPRARMLFHGAMCTADAISAWREEGLSSIVAAVHSRWIPVTGDISEWPCRERTIALCLGKLTRCYVVDVVYGARASIGGRDGVRKRLRDSRHLGAWGRGARKTTKRKNNEFASYLR